MTKKNSFNTLYGAIFIFAIGAISANAACFCSESSCTGLLQTLQTSVEQSKKGFFNSKKNDVEDAFTQKVQKKFDQYIQILAKDYVVQNIAASLEADILMSQKEISQNNEFNKNVQSIRLDAHAVASQASTLEAEMLLFLSTMKSGKK